MDGTCRIYRRVIGCLGLLCALFVVTSADAATRRYPTMPTAERVGTGGTAVDKVGTTYSIDMDGVDYIPSDYTSSKGTKLPVKSKYWYSIPRTFSHAKNWMKGGLGGVALGIAMDAMLDHVGAFIDEAGQPMKNACTLNGATVDPSVCATPQATSDYYSYGLCSLSASSTLNKITTFTHAGNKYAAQVVESDSVSAMTSSGWRVVNNCTSKALGYKTDALGKWPVSIDLLTSSNNLKTVPVSLTESDYGLMEAFANAQNSAWLQGLLKDVCAASTNPGGCYSDLKEQGSQLAGPATLAGPSKTTTTTSTSPAGVTQQTTTTQGTTYNITYGSNYYDYSKQITTTTTNPDGSTTTSTETETPTVTEEETPEEEDQEEQYTAAPCSGSQCDGPAYQDQYTPTDTTKEQELDSYASRVQGIPIIQAMNGLFNVSAGGACPVWSYQGNADILGFIMPIDLVFDYLCLPWFVQYGPWIRAVIYLVACYAAIRVALL